MYARICENFHSIRAPRSAVPDFFLFFSFFTNVLYEIEILLAGEAGGGRGRDSRERIHICRNFRIPDLQP